MVSTPTGVERPLWRGWLHVGGVVLLAAFAPLLLSRAHGRGLWIWFYLVGVATMMGASALFHRVTWSTRARAAWRRVDHSTIYAAIVGTYLALAGVTLTGRVRTTLILLVVAAALVGIVVGQVALGAPKWVNALPYVVVGWGAIFFVVPIERGGGLWCLIWVLVGGLAYSVGAAVYGAKRPRLNPKVFSYHEVFHALTLVGAGAHYLALYSALGHR